MSTGFVRGVAALAALAMLAVACGDDGGSSDDAPEQSADIDYEAIGLWDDGACDPELEPLRIGLMTVFESPVISLVDQALALEAAAAGFNDRGGANGACIEVVTCDDGGNADEAIACVREIDEAGVVATVNDQGTAAQGDVSEAMAEAGIPRVASNVTTSDWGDQNAFPLHGSGFGQTLLSPQALIGQGVTDIGVIRVDLAEASAIIGLFSDLYPEATFDPDMPVAGGTTDFSQFILAAEDVGAEGVTIALGEQEAVQIVRAGQQLGTELSIGASLGTFPHETVAELGDFAQQLAFLWSFPPATADLPVYEALRADMAASGEESLQVGQLKASPMGSWIGLYALLYLIRDADMTEFTREGITAMLETATDVPMLGMFGDQSWTPDLDHPGIWQRIGTTHWATYRWDPEAEAPDGLEGNFVETATIDLAEILCGSPFGAPEPC